MAQIAQIAFPQLSDTARDYAKVPLPPQVPPNKRDLIAAAQLVKDLTMNYGM
jgi:hypothetical protein